MCDIMNQKRLSEFSRTEVTLPNLSKVVPALKYNNLDRYFRI